MAIETVSASELPRLLSEDRSVIDVRSGAEYRAAHVAGAEPLPLDQFDPEAFIRRHGKQDPVYILCQSGKRARIAAGKLADAGHRAVHVVEGGTDAAIQAGVEVVRARGAISIERQVRIAAGSLVVAGSLAGLMLHPGFFALPIFIGAGLVFAGITDTCGMGLLLARMPWNR